MYSKLKFTVLGTRDMVQRDLVSGIWCRGIWYLGHGAEGSGTLFLGTRDMVQGDLVPGIWCRGSGAESTLKVGGVFQHFS